jgi:hypothetical protein
MPYRAIPTLLGLAFGLMIWVFGSAVLWGYEHRSFKRVPYAEVDCVRSRRQRGAHLALVAPVLQRPSL